MSMRILFYGFRHSHINSLYKKICDCEHTEIIACIETDDQAREKAEKILGASFSDKTYEEWLESDFEAVAIGAAYGDRGEAIIKALTAGKHVIADKPICTSIEQLDKIRKLSKEKNLKIACMLDLRYIPQSIKAKDIIISGCLGEVRNVSFNGQHYIDYANRPHWYFEDGMHGGTINDLAIHGVDLVRMITGLEFDRTYAARTWNAYAVKNENFKDCATFMASLENGAGVLADVSYSAPAQAFSMPSYWEFRFWCGKGMLQITYNDNHITLFKDGEPETLKIECDKTGENYLTEFIAEIENNSRHMTENILRSTECALKIQEAADRETEK